MSDDTATRGGRASSLVDVSIGTTVYDADGNELGNVRGLDDAGFYVRSVEGTDVRPLTEARELSGEAYLMWRCWECGEMGRLDADLPDACPACGATREELYYWAED